MSNVIPITLVTGLLGSGKSTLIQQLITQQPDNENWAILINEFGEVDIDSFILQNQPKTSLHIESVAGGCICCTAQFTLVTAVNRLLQQFTKIDRLIIEPTGLGHPASVIDTLKQSQFHSKVSLQQTICLVTAMQLTLERWQKSKVMRDLVTLADTLILNKTDLATETELNQSQAIISKLYPPKNNIINTKFAKVNCVQVFTPPTKSHHSLTIMEPINKSGTHKTTQHQVYESAIPSVESCFVQYDPANVFDSSAINSMGWIWPDNTQFNRTKIKTLFEHPDLNIKRAKGIIKTGKDWQLLQWADNQLSLSDIAWRKDSRLELFFSAQDAKLATKKIEQELIKTIHQH